MKIIEGYPIREAKVTDGYKLFNTKHYTGIQLDTLTYDIFK